MAKADYRVRVIRNRFPQEAVNILRTSQRLSKDIAEDIAAEARRLVPVDTGFLRSSIQVLKRVSGTSGYVVNVYADYAGYVEFGTRYNRAQPFLTPAAELIRAGLIPRSAKALQEGLR